MFKPLRGKTIVLVATSIHYAISEYSATGSKMINKFDGNTTLSTKVVSPFS